MAQADEKDKVGDVHPPEDGPVHTRDAQAEGQLANVGIDAPGNDDYQHSHRDVEPLARAQQRLEKGGILLGGTLVFHALSSTR